jgi:thiosulfate/3-mercaptopyruvate sulfurtransferase
MMTTLLLTVHLIAAEPADYPAANLLIEVKDPALAKEFHILDARSDKDYLAGHIPGAVWVDLNSWSKALMSDKADADFWKAELAKVGVRPRQPVAVYSEDARDAARVWWMMKYAGVPDVRIINGGWKAYTAAELPVDKGRVVAAVPQHDWKMAPERLADKAAVLAQLKSGGIIDNRSDDEYFGLEKKSKQAGCIPGAVHLEWTEFLDPKTGKYIPPPDLIMLVKDRKVDLNKPAITYCQGGGRAAVAAFGLELAGAKNVKNYYFSWGEWGNAEDTPVELKKK